MPASPLLLLLACVVAAGCGAAAPLEMSNPAGTVLRQARFLPPDFPRGYERLVEVFRDGRSEGVAVRHSPDTDGPDVLAPPAGAGRLSGRARRVIDGREVWVEQAGALWSVRDMDRETYPAWDVSVQTAVRSTRPGVTWAMSREASGDWTGARGVRRVGDRADVFVADPRSKRLIPPVELSFHPPAGWAVTAPSAEECEPGMAIWAPLPVDPCVEWSTGVDGVRLAAGEGRPAGWVALVRTAGTVPPEWLLAWDGLAASLLPAWTAGFRLARPPVHERSIVAFAVEGDVAGRPVRVEAAVVDRGRWVCVVALAVPPDAPGDAAETVRRVARSLTVASP